MYPIYDTVDRPDIPKSPLGCVWYFLGFCVFVVIAFAVLGWMS